MQSFIPPRQWKMWILRCVRWFCFFNERVVVWLVAVVFRYFFFHINVLMYIAQIVRELIAGPGGIKNPSLKESEAWHLWRRTLLSGLALPPHVLQRVGKDVTKFIVERAHTHTHTHRLTHTQTEHRTDSEAEQWALVKQPYHTHGTERHHSPPKVSLSKSSLWWSYHDFIEDSVDFFFLSSNFGLVLWLTL